MVSWALASVPVAAGSVTLGAVVTRRVRALLRLEVTVMIASPVIKCGVNGMVSIIPSLNDALTIAGCEMLVATPLTVCCNWAEAVTGTSNGVRVNRTLY